MVQFILPLDPKALLPPLLACLPTAFVSPRPPPALLPLLSPILRQRVQLLSETLSRSESWLSLLCWDDEQGQRLPEVVEGNQAYFEPHPVSGEVEFKDLAPTQYRRLDQETLQAKVTLQDFGLETIFLWCPGESDNGTAQTESPWKVAEVRIAGARPSSDEWHQTIADANEAHSSSKEVHALQAADASHAEAARDVTSSYGNEITPNEDDDDDDYWQQYDRTPGNRESPDPTRPGRQNVASEEEHYARYGDVQPAMDNDEPSVNGQPKDEHRAPSPQGKPDFEKQILDRMAHDPLLGSHQGPPPAAASEAQRNPISTSSLSSAPSSRPSNPAAHLEDLAASQNISETGVKQHISTSMKSLFRLSRTVGMDREEFVRLVNTELEVLSLMDAE
ncbi:MAG: hypothetical protein M4579_000706 [Chaenotheca gracillima]|nr:MAG: hypothetical protein M4579_000706 [Chaenotheca gracillima]